MIKLDDAEKWRIDNGFASMYDINNGDCENFAIAFVATIPGGEVIGTDNVDGWDSDYPGHIWIYDGKRHYDSECLDGVEEWKNLPFFVRAIKRWEQFKAAQQAAVE